MFSIINQDVHGEKLPAAICLKRTQDQRVTCHQLVILLVQKCLKLSISTIDDHFTIDNYQRYNSVSDEWME